MAVRSFACFGTTCAVRLDLVDDGADVEAVLDDAQGTLLDWHTRFSRFLPGSELSHLNADPAATVAVSSTMARLVLAARAAAELTDGLVDPTLVGEIEDAGYRTDLDVSLALPDALGAAPARRPASARPERRWQELVVDVKASTLTRPPGLRLDSGGIAKGLFADLVGTRLVRRPAWVVDCGGDLRVGGTAGLARPIDVRSPFDAQKILHRLELRDGGVATSSIGDRSWRDADGRPAHHLLDPATGRPAFTGVVQATALAPTAAEAEARAKAALLTGPETAVSWLSYGGVIVLDDGSSQHLSPP